jgi:ribosomal protein L6P/L9E
MKTPFYSDMISSEIKYPSEVRIEYISSILNSNQLSLKGNETKQNKESIFNDRQDICYSQISNTTPGALAPLFHKKICRGTSYSSFLNFHGPLGSISIDLQKIDPYGLSFFSIKSDSLSRSLFIYVNKNSDGESRKIAEGLSGSLSSLCRNNIKGVSQGFVLFLELIGVGYKANISDSVSNNSKLVTDLTKNKSEISNKCQNIEFKLGQSHDILFPLPNSVKAFSVKPTVIGLYGINKSELGQIASKIKELRPPEPYKGKGIRYKDEIVQLKIGKKK